MKTEPTKQQRDLVAKSCKHARKVLGLSQTALAKEVNLNQAYISWVESGNPRATISMLKAVWKYTEGTSFPRRDLGAKRKCYTKRSNNPISYYNDPEYHKQMRKVKIDKKPSIWSMNIPHSLFIITCFTLGIAFILTYLLVNIR